jgi:hypothetical protein
MTLGSEQLLHTDPDLMRACRILGVTLCGTEEVTAQEK